jgi:outer membrane beta-barrel protein
MRAAQMLFATLATLVVLMGAPTDAQAGSRAAKRALDELNEGRKPYNVVQNRFFLKGERFEVTPILGYVPNNPMVKRYVGGVLAGYHFSETLAAEGAFLYSPDLGTSDLKGLTNTLVAIANNGTGNASFQQPLDKMLLGATFAARWSPLYGKLNLIGEQVLNFDAYFIGGLGMLSINEYYAEYSGNPAEPSQLQMVKAKTKVPVNLGFGMNFFMSSSVALKVDARSYFYVDKKPQYDPNVPVNDSRLYNNFVASVGASFFFPKMKPRRYDF